MTLANGGCVELALCGSTHRLRMDWNALAALRSQFGPDFQTRINEALMSLDFEVIASCLSVATGGKVASAQIMSAPPPVVPAVRSLHEAFQVAYHGPEGLASSVPFAPARRLLAKLRARLSAIAWRLGWK